MQPKLTMVLPLSLPEAQNQPVLSESYRTMLADRLSRIRKAHLVSKAAHLWPSARQIPSFGEMNSVHEHALQEEVVIFGILILNGKRRTSAVKTYRTLLEPDIQTPIAEKLVTDGDTYYVEDGGIKIQLDIKAIPRSTLVPGAVIALRGLFAAPDTFSVSGLLYPVDVSAAKPLRPSPDLWIDGTAQLVLFVAGMGLGWEAAHAANAMLFATALGTSQLTSIKQVVLCGGTYAPVDAGPAAAACLGNALSPTTGFLDLQASYDLVDTILARIAAARPTVVVSGQSDPTPRLWPQAPIPNIVLPRCSLTNSLTSASCPAKLFTIDKQIVWIIDGAVLTHLDALLPSSLDVSMLVATLLQTAHLCPQAPLFFDAQPLQSDMFILDEPPHCIVVGGHPQTATPEAYTIDYNWNDTQHTCKVFCIPSFTSAKSTLCWDTARRWSTLKLDSITNSLS
ncbi:DNA polymerase alpha/epsilon subunit B [Giardia duodenalis assemblage B]|uniref:DNA polymerase alpha/epsilon subunit B n=2 Tax=Giardia intestinalis TaxID=5741 RepID=A0A132NWY0_GIAIN|nr:DNA polymerase alpha/epsilon subunit B [Giardia intestinalis]KWX14563.1 DNA polymerase alpha/epsilon subunit B [Giardia intestinalis assemblage B]